MASNAGAGGACSVVTAVKPIWRVGGSGPDDANWLARARAQAIGTRQQTEEQLCREGMGDAAGTVARASAVAAGGGSKWRAAAAMGGGDAGGNAALALAMALAAA